MAQQLVRICVVGSANIDLTFRAPQLPQPGETLAGDGFEIGFGGKGANQAVMAARLGAQVTMVAKVGNDVFGQEYLANLRQHGVDVAHVTIAHECATGAAGIVVERSGQNSIIVVPGANARLTPADVGAAAGAIQSAQLVIGQFEVPRVTTLEAFRLAKASGATTLLNPAPAGELTDELLRHTDILVVNEIEAEQIAERRYRQDSSVGCLRLLRDGPRLVVVTLGERGAVLFDSARHERVPTAPVEAIDTTGAGDAFVGSLAVLLAEGADATIAVRRANLAAALSVTKAGAQASYPTRSEVESIALQQGAESGQ